MKIKIFFFSVGMTYFGIALHTPEFGSNVYMVFFLGGLIEIPTNLAGQLQREIPRLVPEMN